MLIETWVALMLLIMLCAIGFIALVGWINDGKRLEDCRRENNMLREENAELKKYIAVQKTKNIINVANDFYNEGKKK